MNHKCNFLNNFNEQKFALEIVANVGDSYPTSLVDAIGKDIVFDTLKWFSWAQGISESIGADFISVYFNYSNLSDVELGGILFKSQKVLIDILNIANMPIIVRGTGQKDIDEKFLPKLISAVDFAFEGKKLSNLVHPIIFAFAQETNYKSVVNAILKSKFKDLMYLVLRAPIDITLTKELNILAVDEGISKDKILIDTDTGCVGMGLDYGYSIIERICIARLEGDSALNAPIIVFSGEETFRAKEAKSEDFQKSWGELSIRTKAWEIATTSALLSAGANIAVCWNPQVIKALSAVYKKNNRPSIGDLNGRI